VLKALSTSGGAAPAALSINGRAEQSSVDKERMRQEVEPYSSTMAVRKALTTHAKPLLEELVTQGLLTTTGQFLEPIAEEEFTTPDQMELASNSVSVYALSKRGEPILIISVYRTFGDVHTRMFVKPTEERSHLIINGDVSETILPVGSNSPESGDGSPSVNTMGDVTTSGGCLSGGCCEPWVTTGSEGCTYVNFDCCVDSNGCYYCIDTGTSDCNECWTSQGCYCDCPDC